MVVKLLCPKMRFRSDEPIGAFKRAVDKRTVDELRESIQLWARRVPEVKQILPELEHMNPKYFGLVADTIELSQKKANSFQDIDMMQELDYPPFNSLDLLMAHIPIAARKSPSALDFAKEIINRTGMLTSKFFLKDSAEFELLVKPNTNANFREGIGLIDDFVRMSESSMPIEHPLDLSTQEGFMEHVFAILDEGVIVEKIPILKDVFKKLKGGSEKVFDMDKFLQDGTPVEVIKANLKTFEQAKRYSERVGKYLDVNAQLSKDPNDVDTVFCLDSIPKYMLED